MQISSAPGLRQTPQPAASVSVADVRDALRAATTGLADALTSFLFEPLATYPPPGAYAARDASTMVAELNSVLIQVSELKAQRDLQGSTETSVRAAVDALEAAGLEGLKARTTAGKLYIAVDREQLAASLAENGEALTTAIETFAEQMSGVDMPISGERPISRSQLSEIVKAQIPALITADQALVGMLYPSASPRQAAAAYSRAGTEPRDFKTWGEEEDSKSVEPEGQQNITRPSSNPTVA